jgi:hypothetical protein
MVVLLIYLFLIWLILLCNLGLRFEKIFGGCEQDSRAKKKNRRDDGRNEKEEEKGSGQQQQ